MKKSLIFMFVMLLVALISFNVSAITISDTYSDVASTSSQAINLVNYAASYKSFFGSDFVVFCDSQNSYYIVWGELKNNNGTVSGSDIEYIHYYRVGSIGTSQYIYEYGTDNSFGLNPDNAITTNISDSGFVSSVYEEYKLQDSVEKCIVFITGFLFVIMILKLRREK